MKKSDHTSAALPLSLFQDIGKYWKLPSYPIPVPIPLLSIPYYPSSLRRGSMKGR